MQNKVRFNDISMMRVFAMLLVVLYHCFCPYTTIWDGTPYAVGFHVPIWQVIDSMLAQIHLPIFFLISGYLYGFKAIRGGVLKHKKVRARQGNKSLASIHCRRIVSLSLAR